MTVPAEDRRVGLLRTRPSFFCSISAASFRAYVLALRFACLADRAALSALKEIKRNSDRGPRLKTCTHSYVKKVLRLKSARGYIHGHFDFRLESGIYVQPTQDRYVPHPTYFGSFFARIRTYLEAGFFSCTSIIIIVPRGNGGIF